MDTSSLSKIVPLTAEELFVRASLSEQARRLLAPSLDVATFLERLLKADLFVDSVRLLAFALPLRPRRMPFWPLRPGFTSPLR